MRQPLDSLALYGWQLRFCLLRVWSSAHSKHPVPLHHPPPPCRSSLSRVATAMIPVPTSRPRVVASHMFQTISPNCSLFCRISMAASLYRSNFYFLPRYHSLRVSVTSRLAISYPAGVTSFLQRSGLWRRGAAVPAPLHWETLGSFNIIVPR